MWSLVGRGVDISEPFFVPEASFGVPPALGVAGPVLLLLALAAGTVIVVVAALLWLL